jgi:CHRD domain-containing protein
MKTLRIVLAGLMFAATVATVAHVAADDRDNDRDNRLRTKLAGFNEVPIVSTEASGRLMAQISKDEQSIEYSLTINDLQGIVAQAHIHLAQRDVNGGIVLWLCQGTARAPAQVAATTPECPQEGEVTGMLTAASVTPVATQQIGANELDEVIAAIRAGKAYANVHTNLSPGGEMRGQIDADHGGHR